MGKIEERNGHHFYAEGERATLGVKGSLTVVVDGDLLMRPIADKVINAVGHILRGVWPIGLEPVLIEDAPGAPTRAPVVVEPKKEGPFIPARKSSETRKKLADAVSQVEGG